MSNVKDIQNDDTRQALEYAVEAAVARPEWTLKRILDSTARVFLSSGDGDQIAAQTADEAATCLLCGGPPEGRCPASEDTLHALPLPAHRAALAQDERQP